MKTYSMNQWEKNKLDMAVKRNKWEQMIVGIILLAGLGLSILLG